MKNADKIKKLEGQVQSLQKKLGLAFERADKALDENKALRDRHRKDAEALANLLRADMAFQIAAVLRYGQLREDGSHAAHIPAYDVDELNAKYMVRAARSDDVDVMRVVVEKRETA